MRSHVLIFLFCLTALAGCVSKGPEVPENAQLLWYGRGRDEGVRVDMPQHTGLLYVFEENSGRVIQVDQVRMKDSWAIEDGVLESNRYYRIYFVPDMALPDPVPTTQP